MKIEANDKEVQDIFSSGYFQIPRFQRPYSWGKEEVENFWNDIIFDKTDSYFIGSMVVYQTKKPYFGIVDGQQHLTTITIALSVIRDAFISVGEKNLAKGVHKFIETPNNDYENEFVLNAETSFPYLQNHIQTLKLSDSHVKFESEVGIEETNLKIAYDLIAEKLDAHIPEISSSKTEQMDFFGNPNITNKLKDLRDKFLALKLVFIQLDNEDDAYLIFETLNARGRDLRTSDLVKNLILKTIKNSSAVLDSPKEAWNTLVKKFDDITEKSVIDSFLLHFWISKYAYSTDKTLFSLIKEFVLEDKGNARILLEGFMKSSSSYCKMLNPETFNWSNEQQEIKNSLISLNGFKVKQQSSFVLALLDKYFEKSLSLKQVKRILSKIEHFHFVFNAITQQRSSGSIATMYSQHAIRLNNADSESELQSIISSLSRKIDEKIPSYEEFEVKFLELKYLSNKTKSKNIIKYSLCKLIGTTANGLNIDSNSLTIEHLIPEAELKNGSPAEIIGNIGNLLLTDSKTNSDKLKNKTPKEKLKILKDSSYPLENNHIYTDEFDGLAVDIRARKICQSVYGLTVN